MDDGGIVDVWNLKHILMSADQICLSRMQIHVILSIVHPNEVGEVDADYFLRVACTVIPWMFDVARFMEKADMIAAEKAEAQKRAEQQELEAFTSGAMAVRNRGAGEADEVDELQQKEPDKEQVEKILISSANHQDQNHRQAGTLEVSKFLEAMHPDQVAQCQLQDHELRGFIAEAEIEMRGNSQEIAYVEHIKTWVPIIFELRRSHVYGAILSKDWGFGADHLVDLRAYEAHFPLHSEHIMERPDSAASRRSGGFGGRQPSSRGDRRMSSRRSRTGSQMLHSDDLAGLRQSQRGSRAGSARRQRPQSGKGSRERSLSRAGSTRSMTRANSQRSLHRMQSGDSLDSMASRRSSARGGGSR
jgi:hypothetical protein